MSSPEPSGADLRVVVAIPTFHRPREIARLLEALPSQVEGAKRQHPGIDVEVLVIDNDPDASARAAISQADAPFRYVVEPARGLSAVRNRAFDEAVDRRLLIFIDDDEVPRADWLGNHLEFWRRETPAAVLGRVVSVFQSPIEPWIEATGMFTKPVRTTGDELRGAATNNLLLDLDVVRRLGLRFDPRLGLSGGEDALLTERLRRAGGRILWNDEAVVDDFIPDARLTRSWVRRRAYRGGTIAVAVALLQQSGVLGRARVRVRSFGAGIARIAGGSANRLRGIATRSVRLDARGARAVWRGFGMIAGSTGYVYPEYAKRATS
jgi:succinoglycan biosynthesis protein ExoM